MFATIFTIRSYYFFFFYVRKDKQKWQWDKKKHDFKARN